METLEKYIEDKIDAIYFTNNIKEIAEQALDFIKVLAKFYEKEDSNDQHVISQLSHVFENYELQNLLSQLYGYSTHILKFFKMDIELPRNIDYDKDKKEIIRIIHLAYQYLFNKTCFFYEEISEWKLYVSIGKLKVSLTNQTAIENISLRKEIGIHKRRERILLLGMGVLAGLTLGILFI